MAATSPLAGKFALITGASRGIGAAIAEALAVRGCNLVLTARDLAGLTDVASNVGATGIRAIPYACDVRDEIAVNRLMAGVRENFGRLDILVNNAGIAHALANVQELATAVWRDVIDTNVTGMFLITRAALPLMQAGSSIVNNLSISAQMSFVGSAAYTAAKHGALGFTNTLREELRPRGIRVIALVGGATATDIWNQFWPQANRASMMSAATVAEAVAHTLELPPDTVVEEIRVMPISGTNRD